MSISLHQFAKDNRLSKTTVHNRARKLGISTADGLASDDADRLLIEFDCVPQIEEPAAVATATVEVGNHQMVLAAPQLPQAYSLESLRACEAVFIDDPLEVAKRFLEKATEVTTAMKGDIAQREQRLDDTRKAKDAIDAKANELRLEARLYEMQTAALDKNITTQTANLQESLSQLQSLGKPQDS